MNNDSRNNDRSAGATPVSWDPATADHPAYHGQDGGGDTGPPMRNDSNALSRGSGGGSGVSQMSVRRHDYETHSAGSETGSTRSARVKNPIPNPKITIRSEYPTLTRSKDSQNLTCLVTIEVAEGKWQPDMEDIRSMRPRLSQTVERAHRSGPSNGSNRVAPTPKPQPTPEPSESTEELDRVTQDLYSRVDNWHGLDFSR